MKKVLSLILTVTLLVSMMSVAFAADSKPKVNITSSSKSVKAGETVTLTVSVDKALEDIISFGVNLYFDENVFDKDNIVINKEGGNQYITTNSKAGNKDGKMSIPISGLNEGYEFTVGAGKICTVTFTAKSDLVGTSECKFEIVNNGTADLDYNTAIIDVCDPITVEVEGTPISTYNVTIDNNIANGSVTASPTSAKEGDVVTLTPVPDNECIFKSWTVTYVDGEETKNVAVNDNKFTMPAFDVKVSAEFIKSSEETFAEFELAEAVTGTVEGYIGIPLNMSNTTGEEFAKAELTVSWNKPLDGRVDCSLLTPSFYTTVEGLSGTFGTVDNSNGNKCVLTIESADGKIAAGDLGKLVFKILDRACDANKSHTVKIESVKFYDAEGNEKTIDNKLENASCKVSVNYGIDTDPGYKLTIPEYDEAVFSANWGLAWKPNLEEYATGTITNVTPHYGLSNVRFNRYQYLVKAQLTGDKQIDEVGYTIDGLGIKVPLTYGYESFNIPCNDITLYATFCDGYKVKVDNDGMENGSMQVSLDGENWSDEVTIGSRSTIKLKYIPDPGYKLDTSKKLVVNYTLKDETASTNQYSAGQTIAVSNVGSDVSVSAYFVECGTIKSIEKIDAGTGNTYYYRAENTTYRAAGAQIKVGETVSFTIDHDSTNKKYCSKIEYSTDNETWTAMPVTIAWSDSASLVMPSGDVYIRMTFSDYPVLTVAEDLDCTVTLTSTSNYPGSTFKATVSDIPEGYRLSELYYEDADGNKTNISLTDYTKFPSTDCTVYAKVTNSTETDYTINTAEEFCKFMSDVKNGDISTLGKIVVLGNDIDLTGSECVSCDFNGIFDGKGHTVSGLTAPLFNNLSGATVKNVTLDGSIKSAESFVGAVAGSVFGNVTIENCVNKADVTGTKTNANVGGMVGRVEDASANITIKNCVNKGKINGGYYAAGMVGWCWNFASLNIENCGNEGDISTTRYAAGIVAYTNKEINSISGCYNTGTVSLTNGSWDIVAGGIMGYGPVALISDCYNAGTVTAYSSNVNYASSAAGIYGGTQATEIKNSYNVGEAKAKGGPNNNGSKAYSGEIVVNNNTTTTLTNCYSSEEMAGLEDALGTLGSDWKANKNVNYVNGYPVLSWQSVPSVYIFTITDGEENGKVDIDAEDNTVTMEVKLSGYDFNSLNAVVTYDADIFELTGFEGENDVIVKYSDSQITLQRIGGVTIEKSDNGVVVASLTFKAKKLGKGEFGFKSATAALYAVAAEENSSEANKVGDSVTVIKNVTVTLPADGSVTGDDKAVYSEDYTGTIANYNADNYNYSVKYTINGVTADAEVNSDGTFVIPGEEITDNITVALKKLNKKAQITLHKDYVTGYTLVLVSDDGNVYEYDGNAMYYMEEYESYAWIAADTADVPLTEEIVKENLTFGQEAAGTIKADDWNVNGITPEEIDFMDAVCVFGCYKVVEEYPVEKYMAMYLRANVASDDEEGLKINMADVNAILNYGK